MHQSDTLKFGKDVAQFSGISLQKFTTGRHIKEQVLYREVTSFRTGYSLLALHLRTRNHQFRSQFFRFRTRLQFYLRHCCDGCQCFPTKSHGTQSKQVRSFPYLGSSMPLKRETGIRFGHSFSIINHLNTGFTRISH